MNNLSLIGRVGGDPEIKSIENRSGEKTLIADFGLAVYRYHPDEDKRTLWVRVKAFGKPAETIKNHVKRGNQLGVSGELACEEWTDRGGNKKQTWYCKASGVHLIGTRDGASQSNNTQARRPAASSHPDEIFGSEEEIPF